MESLDGQSEDGLCGMFKRTPSNTTKNNHCIFNHCPMIDLFEPTGTNPIHRASVSSEPASYSAVAAAAEATAEAIANEVAIEAFSDSSDNSARPPQPQQQGSQE